MILIRVFDYNGIQVISQVYTRCIDTLKNKQKPKKKKKKN